ncbi:peroxiredoxin family protein [uncultured Dokdonia sp.]|uniref:peroxiredoxin family protein n=1 Tax=uncultured Dokdonia sp. TaxID=575653 RepID=UPI00260FE049|nr:peroxiredoxin family protein [uncultured Dokdonia sp.]
MQNLLKSIFVSVFPVFALFITVKYTWEMIQNETQLGSLGIMITSIPIVVFFLGLFIVPRARTNTFLIPYTITILIGVILSLIGYMTLEIKEFIFLSILVLGWCLYLFWYSVFRNRDTSVIRVGNRLPEFTLENSQRAHVSSSSFLGSPAIYLFYRGNWCPLCMAQIKELVAQYKTLEEKGVNMVFVSPQPHGFSEKLAKKHGLQFHFLTDVNNRVAKQLAIASKNGIPFGFQALGYDSDTVLPTVIITDKDGVIQFADVTDNYRVRPEPDFFLEYV